MEAKRKTMWCCWGGYACGKVASTTHEGRHYCHDHGHEATVADAMRAVVSAAEAWVMAVGPVAVHLDATAALQGAVRALRAAREGGG